MNPNFEKVPIWHYPLPEGTPRVCTGFYFRRIVQEVSEDPDVSATLEGMLTRPPLPETDGGSTVPLNPPPKGPTPLSGVAKPLPKILVP